MSVGSEKARILHKGILVFQNPPMSNCCSQRDAPGILSVLFEIGLLPGNRAKQICILIAAWEFPSFTCFDDNTFGKSKVASIEITFNQARRNGDALCVLNMSLTG